jgi:hypothetical protein
VSEEQTWSSEDTRVFSFKVFFGAGSLLPFASRSYSRHWQLLSCQRQNALSSLRKVCSLLHDFSFNCGIRVQMPERNEKAPEAMNHRSLSTRMIALKNYVPCAQEERYFSCWWVRRSMRIPIEASFNLATQFSTSLGTS